MVKTVLSNHESISEDRRINSSAYLQFLMFLLLSGISIYFWRQESGLKLEVRYKCSYAEHKKTSRCCLVITVGDNDSSLASVSIVFKT